MLISSMDSVFAKPFIKSLVLWVNVNLATLSDVLLASPKMTSTVLNALTLLQLW